MATLVIRHPDGAEEEVELEGSLSVGRAEGNDLVLTEGGVSRKHARFFIEGDEVHVEDSGSANGTWVDGERIEGALALEAKSQVVIGDYELSVKTGGAKRSSAAPKRSKPAPRNREPTTPSGRAAHGARSTKVVPVVKRSGEGALARRQQPRRVTGPQLRGLNGPLVGKTFVLSGTMTVGRVGGNDITLDDDSVSRRHAEVEVSGDEVTLRDLGSANGTTVNGGPVTEDMPLSSGDIVQFGIVELMFETGAAEGRALARRGGGRRRAEGGDEDALARFEDSAQGSQTAGSKKKRLMIIGGSVVGLLFVFVLAKVVTGGSPPAHEAAAPPVELDPTAQIEALMTECRTYASPELGRPDWGRAKAACEKIIELEPIHADANALLKRIQVEKTCEDNLRLGKELVLAGRLEDGVEAYARVGAKEGDCPTYFLRALEVSKDPVDELKLRSGRECKEYAVNGKWENAYRRCEVYARLACQVMEPTELMPPLGSQMKLDGHVGKGDWRPTDPLYVNFLKARERLKPGEPMWQCPVIRAFRPPPKPKPIDETVLKEFRDRYHNNEMGDALFLYFKGRENESQVPLHKILENMNRANEHERARALLQDITQAQNLLQNGSTELTNERPEKAAPPFRQALEVDERLVLGDRASTLPEAEKRRELEKRASYARRTITEQMASVCYNRGKVSADRKDFRQACRSWKLGATFSRGNIDLLRALTNVCTSRAGEAIRQASSCVQFRQVLDFAVEGDGYRQEAEGKMEELGCPSEPR